MSDVSTATDDDAAEVVAAYEWLFEPPGARPADWDEAVAAERLRALISSADGTCLLARDERQVVGFVTVTLDLLSVRFGQRAWVEDLAVDPQHRSRGTGLALLTAAKSWAAERGASHLELDSGLARTRAHAFYRREQPDSESACFSWRLTS